MTAQDAGNRTVCIVDDDPALLRALEFDMSVQGYDVRTYGDAETLIDAADTSPYGCLVVDHRLPRIDGVYLIELMRARGVQAPAILMTSNPGSTLRARCSSLGVPIVEKPLIEDDLSDLVREAMDRGRR